MEPNNIENQIKEKLNAREIQPSSQTWDRLDAMLSVAEEKKTKRSFGWLYIAASILVFVTVGTFFYNQENTTHNPNEVVVANDTITNSNTIKSNTIQEKVNQIIPPTASSEQLVEVEKTNQNRSNTKEVISQNTASHPKETIINQKATVNQNPISNQNQEVIAVVAPKKETAPLVTQSEVALASNEKTSVAKVKVNANSLLSEVDGELELTFREKVLKKVTKNYKEVKVALANRNIE
ncbi:MAG: hypothetical protein V4648_03580 [Bacteroidota bacterium]